MLFYIFLVLHAPHMGFLSRLNAYAVLMRVCENYVSNSPSIYSREEIFFCSLKPLFVFSSTGISRQEEARDQSDLRHSPSMLSPSGACSLAIAQWKCSLRLLGRSLLSMALFMDRVSSRLFAKRWPRTVGGIEQRNCENCDIVKRHMCVQQRAFYVLESLKEFFNVPRSNSSLLLPNTDVFYSQRHGA